MGKLKGIVQLTGNFDGLSFYEKDGEIVVRKTGGFDGEKIKTAANYQRTRENASEFGQNVKAGKYFRTGIFKYLKPLQIPYVHNVVVQLFHDITQLDAESARGQRTVAKGLVTSEAQQLIRQFEFNKVASFSNVFPFKWEMDWEQQQFTIKQFTSDTLGKPKGATHITVTYFTLGLDFEQQTDTTLHESDELCFELGTASTTPTDLLLHCNVPDCPIVFGFLSIRFFQDVNGMPNRLAGGGLKIVAFTPSTGSET